MQTMSEVMKSKDKFPVKWAGRDQHGNYKLASNVFLVKKGETLPEKFLFNYEDGGLDFAIEEASRGNPRPHDHGELIIIRNTLKKESNGKWYAMFKPENPRMVSVWKHFVETDDEGQVIRDENGAPVLRMKEDGTPDVFRKDVKESKLMIELSQLQPVTPNSEKNFAKPYHQSDARTRALISDGIRSQKLSEGRKTGAGRKKGQKSERIKRGSRHYAEALQKAAK